MCGINGIIYKNTNPHLAEIKKMNMAIRHRGPDDEGVYKFENILLGHQRLSILDLSLKGKQPMTNDGRFWIVYNGEIYNFKEIKNKLLKIGYKFYSQTDTEVILNAYKEWGVNSFIHFNGMWSFAIFDEIEKKLIISRDRYGVKPCYYYNDKNKFIFSSEIKGIFASDTEISLDSDKISLNEKNLEGLFTTYYNKLDIIPPGYFFDIDLKSFKINKKRWWNSLDNLPEINISYKKNKEKIQNLLINATEARLVSDVKIATSLSGGVDSSIIFSILNNLKKHNDKIDLNPFIMQYSKNETLNEAKELASFYNKKPVIVKQKEPNIDDLSYDLSTIELAQTYFNQIEIYKIQNQNGFKVSIDGHGADECLGGYLKDIKYFGMHFQNSIGDLYKTIKELWGEEKLKQSIEELKLVPGLNKYNFDIKNFSKIKNQGNKYIRANSLEYSNPYLLNDLEDLKDYNLTFQIMYYFSTYGHLQWLLNKWDKASMSQSVEIRSPFLDWRFFQFALSLPPEYKIMHGQNKSILRDSFTDIVPASILQKKLKQGLHQVEIEFNDTFAKMLHNIINDKDFIESNYWDGKKISIDLYNKEEKNNNIDQIWRIIKIFLLNKGLKKRKENLSIVEEKIDENYNKLN